MVKKKDKNLENKNFNQNQLDDAIDEELSRQSRLKQINKTFSETKIFNFAKNKVWPILLPFFIVIGFLIILPLISIIIYAIVKPTGDQLLFELTLQNFIDMFTNASIMMALGLSIAYALVAAIFCIIIGYPIALFMSQLKSKIFTKNMWVLITMPIWISMLLKVLGLQTFFYLVNPSFIGTPLAVIIGMTYMFLPFAIIPIYDSLESRQLDLEEAARDLGSSNWKTFWSVTFRNSMPGVLTGMSLVIVQAATSLIVVHYIGDGKITLIATIIESYFFKGNNFGYGAAISVVLTLLIFILVIVIRIISNKFENQKGTRKWKDFSKVVTSQ